MIKSAKLHRKEMKTRSLGFWARGIRKSSLCGVSHFPDPKVSPHPASFHLPEKLQPLNKLSPSMPAGALGCVAQEGERQENALRVSFMLSSQNSFISKKSREKKVTSLRSPSCIFNTTRTD